MKLVPRSLLSRIFVLTTASVALAVTVTVLLINASYLSPNNERLYTARLNLIRSQYNSLHAIPDHEVHGFIENVNRSSSIKLMEQLNSSGLFPPRAGSSMSILENRLRTEVNPDILMLTTERRDGVFVRLPIDAHIYWLYIPVTHLETGISPQWFAASLLAVLISMLGIWLVSEQVNKPLSNLTEASRRVAAGGAPTYVTENSGPGEIRSLSHSFNLMQKALRDFEANRIIMLAGISHDLRTPLSRIRLALELSLKNQPERLDPMVLDLEEIDRTLTQFMDFARDVPENWLKPGNPIASLERLAEHHRLLGHEVELKQGEMGFILFNAPALERMIGNLIQNAINYGQPPIVVWVRRVDKNLCISVMDRGPGIPPQETMRLMQPFTRLESSRSGSPGAGLGLAIVQRIAHLHKGTLKLLPLQGGGLEARLELPLYQQPQSVS
jgi:two-component system osmolarity sensor histidine kinase EnvZ